MKISAFTTGSKFNSDAVGVLSSASFVAIHGNCTINPRDLGLDAVDGQVHGATSCLGAMTSAGVTENVAVFAIEDPEGAYGTALAPIEDDAKAAARLATVSALKSSGRLGEKPELVWVSSTPGFEEDVLAGIEAVTGPDVPIIGGSAADNELTGDWFVFDRNRVETAGLVVSVMFPSGPISFAYHNGYAPTQNSGTVTGAQGRRIMEIDNRPAFEVYRDWTKGAVSVDTQTKEMQSILSESTLSPLGRKLTELGGVSSYLLAHPAMASASGAMDLFASVEEGEVLTLMTGTEAGLIDRAGRVASLARTAGRMENGAITGALMVYCGGCMLSVRERLDDIVNGVSSSLDGAPFLGTFTFGEQGSILGVGNRHGNLMISCIVFG
jgi:hypothetical protein